MRYALSRMSKKDFLDELISAREAKNPAFGAMVDAARDRRRMLRQLAEERERRGLTQTQIAAAMGTSQSSVARIEAGKGDVKLSTVERYAATLGRKVEWRLARSSGNRGADGGRRSTRRAAATMARRSPRGSAR
jgi:DNA-binding XRE family transcriptional regulator